MHPGFTSIHKYKVIIIIIYSMHHSSSHPWSINDSVPSEFRNPSTNTKSSSSSSSSSSSTHASFIHPAIHDPSMIQCPSEFRNLSTNTKSSSSSLSSTHASFIHSPIIIHASWVLQSVHETRSHHHPLMRHSIHPSCFLGFASVHSPRWFLVCPLLLDSCTMFSPHRLRPLSLSFSPSCSSSSSSSSSLSFFCIMIPVV